MAKWLEKFEKVVGGGSGGPKRVRTLRYLLILGGVGAALMLLNSFVSLQSVEPQLEEQAMEPEAALTLGKKSELETLFETYEQSIENRLKEILENIVGVGTVDVLVTIDSTEEIVVERNEQQSEQITNEVDRNGGRRHITSTTKSGQIMLQDDDGDNAPIISKTLNPKIRGIIVVANGAEHATVRTLIIQAVERGVNVPINRISVVPRKQ
ncbi:stage III sporulation protein AG [Paenibacillus yanchengensis]|uniref:Stage III sporulation protein AG n=1 Tax=Paenibacillus yanchengensis TaxID=2035833 RepID=A0ABW4YKA5_9BACL